MIFLIFLHYFAQDCLGKHNFVSNSTETPYDLHFIHILVFQKNFLLLKLKFRATELQRGSKFDILKKPIFCTLDSRTNSVKAVLIVPGQYL